ncbi:hypothetical protein [Bradyrhizobium valentinum]|uniref:Uncharacterized protein n=1 Tax=Bradyrhizobium valentinum TaxID=1518501 RepID=A0A0R3LLG6_9BRAD|nr:hypothetical protein [Bradyrhizobium valentinum]KRQ94584.1 hypothetical protein CQ10_06865 [Bradyrhizobium valentinum]KRR08599.1 hypothetical protein CP49_19805 [Bradyrhizobium valentinum]
MSLAIILLFVAVPGLVALDDMFANRPAFSVAEQPARRPAECRDVRRMADGIPELDYRIDLSVIGSLTAVQTDQVLWYLVLCSAPDIRIMCVTYQSNGMAIGDRVNVKGGYLRRDANHVLLDPCLANRPEQ